MISSLDCRTHSSVTMIAANSVPGSHASSCAWRSCVSALTGVGMPRPGQAVSVIYRPAGMLGGQSWLTLRARLRDPNGKSYNNGIPVMTATTLERNRDGDFVGRFALPDSVVYAAFAVEDSSATVVDDHAGRDWEILVSDTSNTSATPSFDALNQRAHDMMGRNWEERFATAQRMVALYPRDLRSWNWMHSFESWIGRTDDDSVRARNRATLAAFDSTFASGKPPSEEDVGLMAWYAQSIDSATAARWRARLLQEAPRNPFAIQWRLMAVLDSLRARKDTVKALQRMETLWVDAPPDRRAQVANYAAGIALSTADTAIMKRWVTRLVYSERDRRSAARWAARQFVNTPALRAEGIQRLRGEIDSLDRFPATERALGETVAEQQQRHAASRRRLLATLGQALVAAGDYAAGREALAAAVAKGWDINVFRAARTASLAAADTAYSLTMAAHVAVDPRTPPAFADSIAPVARRVLGAAKWRGQLDSARGKFVTRMLAGASARSLPDGVHVRDLDGRERNLRDLTKWKVTVVAFWSRFCGPAIDDLPRLNRVAAQLARSGVHVMGIVDETRSSNELTAFLQEKHVALPTYLDARHEATRAFNQWGTPSYYVVDAEGRIRFDVTNSADEAMARAEALRLSREIATAAGSGE